MWGDISLWFWFACTCWLVMLKTFSYTYLAFVMSSLKVSIQSLYWFFNWDVCRRFVCFILFFCYWLECVPFIVWISTPYQMVYKYFLFFCSLPFHLVDFFPLLCDNFHSMKSPLFILAFVACAFSIISKNYCQNKCYRDFPLCFLLEVLQFQSLIHFEVFFNII